jgi:predicted dithiol-disulfide oxidoreductase (DUF899 family)
MVPPISGIRQEEFEMKTHHPSGPARIASREEWRQARIALLAKEKALTAMKDARHRGGST